jgi:hypothetical protein
MLCRPSSETPPPVICPADSVSGSSLSCVHVGDVVAGRVQRALRRIEAADTDQECCIQTAHSDYIWQDQV